MRGNHSSPSRWRRRLIGEPSISAGAIWSAIGFAWLLAAVFDEASTIRFVLGGLWLATGVFIIVVAVRGRRLDRGYYAPQSASTVDAKVDD